MKCGSSTVSRKICCGRLKVQSTHGLKSSNEVTYSLWEGNGRCSVSAWFCSHPERSRTSCGRAMGDTKSVHGSARTCYGQVIVGNRVSAQLGGYPARSRTGCGWPKGDTQCVVLRPSSKITYTLWVAKGRYKVSAWFCDYPARSHTCCG